ncbi:MAG: ribonucleoside hydrolase [Ruminococcaceae bacterium]|nr:ribonucleoside hydrolase [Oscillospiraceae bacterium]
MRKIIIDTDTSSDDAVAIVMALRDPDVKVVALTTVAGNVDLEKATKNALISIDYAESYSPPVYAGSKKPMIRELETASQVHGEDGMGDLGTLREPKDKAEEKHAVNAIIDILKDSEKDEIELITIGPLTNIALALIKDSVSMNKLKSITIMGGAHPYNNPHSVSSEFNIMADPDAAYIVFNSGIPITLVTLEACRGDAVLNAGDIEHMRKLGEIGSFCVDCNMTAIKAAEDSGIEPFIELPDPIAYAVWARPEIATVSFKSFTRIERKSPLVYGATLFEYEKDFMIEAHVDKSKTFNSDVVTAVDSEKFKNFLFELVRK